MSVPAITNVTQHILYQWCIKGKQKKLILKISNRYFLPTRINYAGPPWELNPYFIRQIDVSDVDFTENIERNKFRFWDEVFFAGSSAQLLFMEFFNISQIKMFWSITLIITVVIQ